MNMQCRTREYTEGWLGRRRNYICRVCGNKFKHDGYQLPEQSRICSVCLRSPANMKIYLEGFEQMEAK